MNDKPNYWADWVMMNKRLVAILCACAFLALVGGIWLLQSQNTTRLKDFETADSIADELSKSPKLFEQQDDGSMLATLKSLDDKHSILQPRFDSLIAEEMLLRNKPKELDPYAKRTIERQRALGLADFADFSEVSRLSGLHSYKEALHKAHELKTRLGANKAKEATSNRYLLEAFLLLHIATLNQKLSNHEGMVQAIVELKEFLGLTKRKTPLLPHERALAQEMLAHLQDRESSLLDFMEEVPKQTGS